MVKIRLLIALFLAFILSLPANAQIGNSGEGGIGWAGAYAPINGGFLLEAADSRFPSAYVLTAGEGITLTPGSGTLTISAGGGGSAGAGTIFGNWTNASAAPIFNNSGIVNQVLGTTASNTIGWGYGVFGFEAQTATVTLTNANSSNITCNPTSGALTVTLPLSSTCGGKDICISVGSAATQAVSVIANASDVFGIGGNTGTISLGSTPGTSITVRSNNVNGWSVVGTSLAGSTFFRDGFGGNGASGAVTKGATTESNILQINATTFSQTASTTWQPVSNSVVNSTSTQTYAGTTSVQGGWSGGQLGNGNQAPGNGAGPAGGEAITNYVSGSGGNGGAGGTRGGIGEIPFQGQAQPFSRTAGSGSGGIYVVAALAPGYAGANGGGLLTVCSAGALSITGTINAIGATGAANTLTAATNYGVGGGAGGTVYLSSLVSVTNSGTISVAGGAGGLVNGTNTTNDGGMGGGGGWAVLHSPSNTVGTITLSGGAGGVASNATNNNNGGAGSTGQSLSITGTPSLPLIGWNIDHLGTPQNPGIFGQYAIAKHGVMTQKENASFAAALQGSKNFEGLCELYNSGDMTGKVKLEEKKICDIYLLPAA